MNTANTATGLFSDRNRSDSHAHAAWRDLTETYGVASSALLLQQTGLVLVTPAGVAVGAPSIIRKSVVAAGMDFAWTGYVQVSRAIAEELWDGQWQRFEPDRWELICELLESANSLVVLLQSPESAEFPPPSQLLKSMKGPSDPHLGSPTDLRVRVGGLNKILNLVHTSDDAGSVMRESYLLLGKEAFGAAWAVCQWSDRSTALGSCTASVTHSVAMGDPAWQGVSIFHTVVAGLTRAVVHRLPYLESTEPAVAAISQLAQIAAEYPAGSPLSAEEQLVSARFNEVLGLLRAPRDANLTELVDVLAAFIAAPATNGARLTTLLDESGTQLSQIESLVIRTTAALAA